MSRVFVNCSRGIQKNVHFRRLKRFLFSRREGSFTFKYIKNEGEKRPVAHQTVEETGSPRIASTAVRPLDIGATTYNHGGCLPERVDSSCPRFNQRCGSSVWHTPCEGYYWCSPSGFTSYLAAEEVRGLPAFLRSSVVSITFTLQMRFSVEGAPSQPRCLIFFRIRKENYHNRAFNMITAATIVTILRRCQSSLLLFFLVGNPESRSYYSFLFLFLV